MPKDMRTYIDQLQRANELLVIKKEVDPNTQLGVLLSESRNRALLFTNLKGFPNWQLLGAAPANWKQAAMSFGSTPQSLLSDYIKMVPNYDRLTEPQKVQGGPVKEVILRGDQLDLTKMPIHRHHVQDGGLYIGSGLCVTRDPDTGNQNVAILRLMLKDKNKMGLFMVTGRHTWINYEKYEARKQPMPMSIVVGHHPLYYFSAAHSLPYGKDEFALAGTLLGEPVRMVKSETNDILVPADSEIIIEGEVPLDVREPEGPFGEFMGYYTTGMGNNPVVRVKAVTMRKDAIFKALQCGTTTENGFLNTLGMMVDIYKRVKDVEGFIDLKTVNVAPQLGQFTVILQLTPRFKGQAKNVLISALANPNLHTKIAIAVDEDVDPFSMEDVLWAVSTRVNPADDVFIIPGVRGHPMDLSLPHIGQPGTRSWQAYGSKMGIDATKPSLAEAEGRERFGRLTPMGKGIVNLADFLSDGGSEV